MKGVPLFTNISGIPKKIVVEKKKKFALGIVLCPIYILFPSEETLSRAGETLARGEETYIEQRKH